MAIALVLVSTAASLVGPGVARADPWTVPNGDGTSTAVWNFTTPADYVLTNSTIGGGRASLRNETAWWNSTTAADFAGPDNATNIDLARWPGDVALATTSGPSTLLTLQPGAVGEDAWLDRNNNNLNHGSDTTIMLDGRGPQSWPILRFDLSSVPVGAAIDDATLSLYESTGIGVAFVASAHQVTATWNEAQVTWNSRMTGTPWGTPGGDYSAHVVGQLTVDNTVGWKSWNITQLVDLWYRGRLANDGLLIDAPALGANADKTFYSSDYVVDPTLRPRLDIRYRILGATGTYVSRVGGPGTHAAWQTIAWNATERSLVSDEFPGPALDPKWTWTNPPAVYDVGATTPGHLHEVSSTGVDFNGATFTGNLLADGVVGDFTATMKFSANPTANGQKAGLMVLLGSRDWYAIAKANVAGAVNWRALATADAVTAVRANVASGNPIPAWVRIQRAGTTFTASTSSDGTAWTVRDAYTPAFEYPLAVRLGPFAADGLSGTAHVVDVDFVRVTFGADATVAVSTRIGDVTPVDGTWSGWSATYPTPAGSTMAGTSNYIEYRLNLAVTYPDHVPAVGDANLSWWQFAASGTVDTNDLAPGDLASWGNLTTVHSLNGQTIAYAYSLDSGATWTPVVPPADLSSVGTATGKIRFRAALSTTDQIVTPTVTEIRLTYTHVLDHFYVTASASATAGGFFSVTVSAKDAQNATITSWTGPVALAARLIDGVTPGGGTLGVVTIPIASGGTATIATETYTKAETIRILASVGPATGLSDPVVVSPGPAVRVTVTPDNVSLLPFDTQRFDAAAFDTFDNPITGETFNWTVGGGVGSLNASSGSTVILTASPPPANGTVQVQDGAFTATAQVRVIPGVPPWVAIGFPASGAHLTGVVPITYTNSSDAVSVRFEYDAGAGWTVIGTTAVLNGTYVWDTSSLDFAGGALRAIVANNRTTENTTVVSPIEVDNTPPAIVLGAVTDNQAGNGTLTITYATDADVVRVDLTYFDGSWRVVGSDLTIDGSYIWTPGIPINGVTLRAVAVDEVDLMGMNEKQGVGRFTSGPRPPAIAPIPVLYVGVGVAYTLNLSFYVSDPDTPLANLTIWDSDAANVTVLAGAFPALNLTYSAAGTYFVTLWVSDGTDTAWAIVQVVALGQSPPAVVSSPPTAVFDEDTVDANALGAPATAFFLDPEGDPLTFAVLDGVHVYYLVAGNSTIDLWADANWSGAETLRLRASDPTGGFAEVAFRAVVRPVNDTPILVLAFPTVTFDEDTVANNAFGGNVTAHFLDVDGDPLALSVLGGSNVSARVNADGSIDLWAPANWSGSEALRVRATDPSGAFVEGAFLVTVRPVNDPPILVFAFTPVTFDEDTVDANALGGPVTARFFDVEADLLVFTVVGGTQIAVRVNADRTVDMWAAANWSGAEGLRVRATDTSGAFVEAPVLVTVRPVDDAPTFAPIPPITTAVGQARDLDVSAYISDIDTNRSQLVVTTDSPYVQVRGFVLTLAFPMNWTEANVTLTVSDGSLAASQVLRVTIVHPAPFSVYYLAFPPVFLAVVVGVFVQRARWRPTKAFLVDERNEMIREFTLDPRCDVTFDQVRAAGALDAVDRPVKVSKYRAQAVRGDALGLVLLAYGPVTASQIEFAREMLVNVQDKFEDRVKQRLSEARVAEEERTAFRVRTAAVAGMFEGTGAAQVRLAEETRAVHALFDDITGREARLAAEANAVQARALDAHAQEVALAAKSAELSARETRATEQMAALDARKTQVDQLRAGLPEREASVITREGRLEKREEEIRMGTVAIADERKALRDAQDAVGRERSALEDVRRTIDAERRESESRSVRLGEDLRRRSQELDSQSNALREMQATLTDARLAFETMRQERTEWIASKGIDLQAREGALNDREAAVRAQAEANARQLADLAAREEALEIESDRLQKMTAEASAHKAELEATARATEARLTELRDFDARKAEEFRSWQSTMESQGAFLRTQRDALERESNEQRSAIATRRQETDAREAQARALLERTRQGEEDLKAREAAAASALRDAVEMRAQAEAQRTDLARQTADLQAKFADVQRREGALADAMARVAQDEARLAGIASREAAVAEREAATQEQMQQLARARFEAEGARAQLEEARRAVAAQRAEAESLGTHAESARAEAEAQTAEAEKAMKFLSDKALEALDREERMRAREAKLEEQERIVDGKRQLIESREKALAAERDAMAKKASRFESQLEKVRTKLAEAEKDVKPIADLQERNRDLENRLRIIQQKTMDILDREEKLRQREAELQRRAGELGIEL